MNRFILIQLINIFTIMLHGQEVKRYNMDVKINVEQKKLDVKGTLLIDFENQDSITFYLWRNSSITSIINDYKEVPFTFDTIKPLPLPFIGNAGKLVVANPKRGNEAQPIQIEYCCDMQRNMVGFGKIFTDEWIEMGYYSAWYPVHEESKDFISEVKVYVAKDFNISGSGLVTRQDSYWLMNQPWETFDILLVASKDLKTKRIERGSICVETAYATFPETDIDSIVEAFTDVLAFYNPRYGNQDGEVYLKFIIDPTEGTGGYGRKNLIRLKASNFSYYFKLGIAHELSHTWWQKADPKTWEDWLNESFAEYSMLLYLRERISKELYNETLERYRQNSENMPAIWGIERTSENAYTTLYEKGALLLIALEQKLGEDQMATFLRLLIDTSIDNTADYLKALEELSSKEMRVWFEDELKK
jgi:hypothetical protein